MNVKGVAVKSIQDFVKNNHSQHYQEWLSAMPESSRAIMSKPVYASEWYPAKDAAVEPTKAMAKLFYNGDTQKAGWESGRYSAEVALGGIYKIFVKMATPKFIIERASKILPAYYDPSEVTVRENGPKHCVIAISRLPGSDSVIESRIGGWVQKAFEVTGCKNVQINTLQSLSTGANETIMKIVWD
jgi:hypothetical protein